VKKALLVVAATALFAAILNPSGAGAGVTGGTGQVTMVHAATYDAGQNFPVTVCVDGDVLLEEFNTTDIAGPVPVTAGEYDVTIFNPPQNDCTGVPAIQGTLGVAPGANLTAMAYWGPEGPALAVLTNDDRCVEPGNSRVTSRHAAGVGPVDLTVGGAVVLSNLAPGGQASLDVPAGDYAGAQLVLAGTEDLVLDLGTTTVVAGFHLVAYYYGGADGEVGVFTDEIPLDTCAQPVETTTTAAAPTATARPAFTG
jgi:hypothetical protein